MKHGSPTTVWGGAGGESTELKGSASSYLPSFPQMGTEHLSVPEPWKVLGAQTRLVQQPEQSRHPGCPHGAYSLGRAPKCLQTTHINGRPPLTSELWLDEVPRACPVVWTRLAHPGTRQLG